LDVAELQELQSTNVVKMSEVFEEIMIASRTKSKCDKLKEELEGKEQKQSFIQHR
jgi:saccharopine dehydrogenase-like NADP-dependent oxidoreductase